MGPGPSLMPPQQNSYVGYQSLPQQGMGGMPAQGMGPGAMPPGATAATPYPQQGMGGKGGSSQLMQNPMQQMQNSMQQMQHPMQQAQNLDPRKQANYQRQQAFTAQQQHPQMAQQGIGGLQYQYTPHQPQAMM